MPDDEQPSPILLAMYRAMSGEERLKLAEQIFWAVRRLRKAAIRGDHPDWSEDLVNAEVNRVFANWAASS